MRLVGILGGLVASLALASTALAQGSPQVQIVSPANGATVSGPDVTITISVSGTTLVAPQDATSVDQMHVHYLLDVDPTPYLDGTTMIPFGNPDIVHTAATSQTFNDVAPGSHRVTVILGYSNHRAVQPPVDPSVTFTVAAQAGAPAAQVPRQLPNTGDAATVPAALLIALGAFGLLLGATLRRLAPRRP